MAGGFPSPAHCFLLYLYKTKAQPTRPLRTFSRIFKIHFYCSTCLARVTYLNFLGADESYPACNAILISPVRHYGNEGALQCKHSNEIVHVALYKHNQFCISSVNDKPKISFSNTYANDILVFENSPIKKKKKKKKIEKYLKKYFKCFFSKTCK